MDLSCRKAGLLAMLAIISGCLPQVPYGYTPGTYPTGYPVVQPWPVGQPVPGPLVPVIPVTQPVTPPVNPGRPEIPLVQPDPSPSTPSHPADSPPAGFRDFWVPWPLPPRSVNRAQQLSELPDAELPIAGEGNARPLRAAVAGGSPSADQMHESAGLPGRMPSFGERVPGVQSTPAEDLKFRGGHTIADLQFVNLYVGGDESWSKSDIQQIDSAIAAAMADRNLNNVMMQYFNNRPITSVALPSHPLTGMIHNSDEDDSKSPVPHAEESSSLMGLGGYHGSVRLDGRPVYYTADVFSERFENGRFNGIPVFPEPWKNVVATLYHELNEARTDPDVQDAIRHAGDPSAERYLGWTSDRGEECGDYPIDESRDLSTIVREVPLTDGSGTVPVQFQYSNAVHGPEGPIPEPHPLK